MSHNVGGIYVQAKAKSGIDPAAVAGALEAYWRARGAKPSVRDPRTFEPLSVSEGKGTLGIAVLPATRGWIAVAESERYTADFSTAKHLAKQLKTEVIWYGLYGATDGGVLRSFDRTKEKEVVDGYDEVEERVGALPTPFLYFDDLDKQLPKAVRSKVQFLAFEKVSESMYDEGPEPDDDDDDDEDDDDD